MPQNPLDAILAKYGIGQQPASSPLDDLLKKHGIGPSPEPTTPQRSWRDWVPDIIEDPLRPVAEAAKSAWDWASKTELLGKYPGAIARIAAAPAISEFERITTPGMTWMDRITPYKRPDVTLDQLISGERPTGIDVGPVIGDIANQTFTPINVGMGLATGGEWWAANAGRQGLVTGLNALQRIASIPMIAEGAQTINDQDTLMGKGFGVLEMLGGAVGLHAPPMAIKPRGRVPLPTERPPIPPVDVNLPPSAPSGFADVAGEAMINPATGRRMRPATNAEGPLRTPDMPWPETRIETTPLAEFPDLIKQIDQESQNIAVGREANELPPIPRTPEDPDAAFLPVIPFDKNRLQQKADQLAEELSQLEIRFREADKAGKPDTVEMIRQAHAQKYQEYSDLLSRIDKPNVNYKMNQHSTVNAQTIRDALTEGPYVNPEHIDPVTGVNFPKEAPTWPKSAMEQMKDMLNKEIERPQPKFGPGDLVRDTESGKVGRIHGDIKNMDMKQLYEFRDKIFNQPHPELKEADRKTVRDIHAAMERRGFKEIEGGKPPEGGPFVSKAIIDPEHMRMDIGDPTEMIKIFRNTYAGGAAQTAGKELIQNAIDATAPMGMAGRITVDIDDATKTFTIKDNGPGLTREQVGTIYTNLSASGKRGGTQKTIGELGVGKTTYLVTGEHVSVSTVARGPDGKLYATEFNGTPEDIMTKFKVDTVEVPEGTPTGTSVTVKIPSEEPMENFHQYLEHFERYSDSPVPIDINTKDANRWSQTYGKPIQRNIRPKASPIPPKVIVNSETPHTKFRVSIPPEAQWGERSNIALILNNRGMFQGVDSFYTPKVELPDRLVIELDPKVGGLDRHYPLTAPTREKLKYETKADITSQIQKVLIEDAQKKQVGELGQIFDSLKPSPGKRHVLHDVGGRFNATELQAIDNSQTLNGLDKSFHSVIDELEDLFTKELKDLNREITHVGYVFDDNIRGINLQNPAKRVQHSIMLNPFAVMQAAKTPREAANGLVHVMIHEFTHMLERQEGAGYTAKLADVYARFDLEKQLYAKQHIESVLRGDGRQYNSEISNLLSVYQESRGRPATASDALTRTRQSEFVTRVGKGKTPRDSGPSGEAYTKLIRAIKAAKPIREEQELMYSAERAQRIGEAFKTKMTSQSAFRKMKQSLAGEYEKADFTPVQLDQKDANSLFKMVGDSQLSWWQKVRAGDALEKILGEGGATVPQRNELKLLDQVFGGGFSQSLNDAGFIRNPLAGKKINLFHELVNLPRALMASMDFSAPLRQGIGMITHKAFWTSLDDMVKSWGSEKFYKATMEAIEDAPEFSISQHAGLKITDLAEMTKREEAFTSVLAEIVPGVTRSERAYMAFLNKTRFDTFKALLKSAQDEGLNPLMNDKLLKELAQYVNNASGRGSLGSLETAAVNLNSVFFSPRLIASRVKMLSPSTYVNASPFVRKQYMRSLIGIAGVGGAATALGTMFGGELEGNPSSADFGKVRFGNVRLDPFGGFQQYIVAAHRLITGDMKSTTTGREFELGQGYGTPTRKDIAWRFLESKFTPTLSFVTTLMQNKDFNGQPIEVRKEIASRFVPIILQDMWELAKEDPKLMSPSVLKELEELTGRGINPKLALLIPAMLGMGVQSYEPRTPAGTSIMFGDIDERQDPNSNIRY